MPPSGEVSQPPRCQKSRRRKAARPASQLPASRQADVTTQADPTANDNSVRWRATRPRSVANDRPEMRSTPVKHPLSFTSSPVSQPPIPAVNQNRERASCQDHYENLGLYKLASTDPRQDLTATQPRVNSSGFGLSSPAFQQPFTKPFSGLPSRPLMTSPYREAGEAVQERPGTVYPLLPSATRPDTRLTIDAASLPESAAVGRQSWILERLPRRRTGRHPSPDASHVNAAATARQESTGHQSTRHREAAGVTKHPPDINGNGDLV